MNRGTALIAVLLLIALVLSAITTLQATRSGKAHRIAAQQAVRDDCAIIADDLMRRSIFELEEISSLPLRRAALDYIESHGRLGTTGELLKDAPPGARIALALVDRPFVVDFGRHTVEPPVSSALQAWLFSELRPVIERHTRLHLAPTTRVHLGDGDHVLVYGVALLDSGKVFGYDIKEAGIGALIARAFGRRSAFPGLIGGRGLRNDQVFIRVSRGKLELFRTPGHFDPDNGTVLTLPLTYGEAFAGATVQASISDAAVRALVVGGVPTPQSRFYILALIAISAALVTAVVVIQRDRQLADIRSDFVSGVSHELRTPLTQIRMFAETLLLDRVRSEDERRRSLQIINEEARRLTNLVENVLFFSRGESFGVDVSLQECDVEVLITDTVDAFTPLATRRNSLVITDAAPRLIARVDPGAMKQIITNMLDNAVKYGPDGQTIRVGAAVLNGRLRITVDDEGPGIPPEDRDAIWEKFFRLKRDRGTHRSGSGIGLAIVREIVTRHGGDCEVTVSPSGGARFLVDVPSRLAEGSERS